MISGCGDFYGYVILCLDPRKCFVYLTESTYFLLRFKDHTNTYRNNLSKITAAGL